MKKSKRRMSRLLCQNITSTRKMHLIHGTHLRAEETISNATIFKDFYYGAALSWPLSVVSSWECLKIFLRNKNRPYQQRWASLIIQSGHGVRKLKFNATLMLDVSHCIALSQNVLDTENSTKCYITHRSWKIPCYNPVLAPISRHMVPKRSQVRLLSDADPFFYDDSFVFFVCCPHWGLRVVFIQYHFTESLGGRIIAEHGSEQKQRGRWHR